MFFFEVILTYIQDIYSTLLLHGLQCTRTNAINITSVNLDKKQKHSLNNINNTTVKNNSKRAIPCNSVWQKSQSGH